MTEKTCAHGNEEYRGDSGAMILCIAVLCSLLAFAAISYAGYAVAISRHASAREARLIRTIEQNNSMEATRHAPH